MSLRSYRGEPVVVNFFASWCHPCRAEAPQITRVARAFDHRVRVLAVDEDDSRSGATSFAQRYGWTWPIVWDHSLAIAGEYNLLYEPHTVVIDREGRVAWTHRGQVTAGNLTAILRSLTNA